MAPSLRELLASTPLSGGNAPYVEALYEQFLADPQSVDAEMARILPEAARTAARVNRFTRPSRPASSQRATRPRMAAAAPAPLTTEAAAKQGAVSRLVQIYANRGHLIAKLDPLGMQKRPRPRVLELGYFGLSEADLDTEFLTGSRPTELAPRLKLREIIAQLEHAYCGTIGAEFAHVSDTEERLWLQDQYLVGRLKGKLTAEEQKNLLWQLSAAEGLERYLHTKYVGQKRFSLEGGDSLIPLLDDLIQQGGQKGVEEGVIGMAHRGRLNVLVNVLGKSPSVLFNEFEGKYDTAHLQGSGDVKYHKGFSSDLRTPGGNVHVALAFNPSHLEVVNPVVEGSVRARQERRGDTDGRARAADPHPRRRGLRGPGRGHGDAAALAGARVLHRRHGAHHREQPGRLHHLASGRRALDDVLLGRRQDARDADLPRERRRSGSGGVRRRAWRSRTASSSTRTWSSTSSAIAVTATTRRTNRPPRSR